MICYIIAFFLTFKFSFCWFDCEFYSVHFAPLVSVYNKGLLKFVVCMISMYPLVLIFVLFSFCNKFMWFIFVIEYIQQIDRESLSEPQSHAPRDSSKHEYNPKWVDQHNIYIITPFCIIYCSTLYCLVFCCWLVLILWVFPHEYKCFFHPCSFLYDISNVDVGFGSEFGDEIKGSCEIKVEGISHGPEIIRGQESIGLVGMNTSIDVISIQSETKKAYVHTNNMRYGIFIKFFNYLFITHLVFICWYLFFIIMHRIDAISVLIAIILFIIISVDIICWNNFSLLNILLSVSVSYRHDWRNPLPCGYAD